MPSALFLWRVYLMQNRRTSFKQFARCGLGRAWLALGVLLCLSTHAIPYMVTPVYAAADSEEKEFWSSSRKSTSLAREAEEQNLTLPVEIKKLAEPIRNRPAEQDSTKTSIL